jgi:hypothetical protein
VLEYFRQLFGHRQQDKIINIVSGLPRSGTSMMMKALEVGGIPPLTDNIRTADEDNPKGYYEFERVKKLRQGDVVWLPGAQGKVVKIIAALLPYLPETYTYRIVLMHRAMPEILASQRKMLINRGEDPNKIGDDELSRLYEQHLRQVNDWINSQSNVRHIEVSYNQLVTDSYPQLERVNRFFDNALDVEAMVKIIDPGLYRQRKQI